MKLQKYVVHTDGYMFEDPHTYTIEAENDTKALQEVLDWKFAKRDDDWEGTWKEYKKDQEEMNGDGAAYITVFSVSSDETIYGK